MTVVGARRLPGGETGQIRYTGNRPPQVYINDRPAALAEEPPLFGSDTLFAEMRSISAPMDRQADQLFREAAALSANPAQLTPTFLGMLPAGAREYSYVSTMTGSGVCSRSVEITSQGSGAPPRVVTHTSGDCGPAGGSGFQIPTQQPAAPVPNNRPRMIWTKATGPRTAPATRVQEASMN